MTYIKTDEDLVVDKLLYMSLRSSHEVAHAKRRLKFLMELHDDQSFIQLPKELSPGELIMRLSPRDRKLVGNLTAEHWYRIRDEHMGVVIAEFKTYLGLR